jgi:hypothetical protein
MMLYIASFHAAVVASMLFFGVGLITAGVPAINPLMSMYMSLGESYPSDELPLSNGG